MAFDFRFATEEDIPRIVEIEESSMSCPWTAKSYLEAVDSDHAFIVVATENNQIAGFAVFYVTAPESELPDIVVSDDFRRRGLGKQLLEYSFNELKNREVDTVFLEVRVSNTPARTLYEKMGFEQIGVRKYFYSNPVEDAICMRGDI